MSGGPVCGTLVYSVFVMVVPSVAAAQAAPEAGGGQEAAPSSSLVVQTAPEADPTVEPHALQGVSLFALASPEARVFRKHDLVQIIVRETSEANSTHELDTRKRIDLGAEIAAWPDIQLKDLLDLIVRAGRSSGLPKLEFDYDRRLRGEGEYRREDDFTARLTAEVIEILPNGNLILESRTRIKVDEEESLMKVTGICRPEDVTTANTVLSNQLHDLRVEKVHRGELKRANERGIVTKVFDALFAF